MPATLNETQSISQKLQQLLSSVDVEYREMKSQGKEAVLVYIKTICDSETIRRYLIKPFWEMETESDFIKYLRSFPQSSELSDLNSVSTKLLQGHAAVILGNQILLLEVRKVESSPVQETIAETVVSGPKDGFTDNILVNLNLIRYRYKKESLQVEMTEVGTASKTSIAILYDEEKVIKNVLPQIKDRLSQIDIEVLQGGGQLAKLLKKGNFTLVPTILITERPDRVAKNLASGKVTLLIDGTPFALVVPSIFSDFFVSMDDEYQLTSVGIFFKILRYIGLMLTLLPPALYVATISYNPEFFRVQLAFSIAASRSAVPYPSFLEVIFMLLMMEFLTEASIRLPKSIGPTATTVGGLILGQAATEAGLVSNIMIIIVSISAISNFVVPVITMSAAVRLLKYPLIILATFFGMIGVVVGIAWLFAYLCNLDSFGTPFFKVIRKGDRG